MNTEPQPRRVLIVDDQQQIHDTFKRVFAIEGPTEMRFAEFETRFLNAEEVVQRSNSGLPTYAFGPCKQWRGSR